MKKTALGGNWARIPIRYDYTTKDYRAAYPTWEYDSFWVQCEDIYTWEELLGMAEGWAYDHWRNNHMSEPESRYRYVSYVAGLPVEDIAKNMLNDKVEWKDGEVKFERLGSRRKVASQFTDELVGEWLSNVQDDVYAELGINSLPHDEEFVTYFEALMRAIKNSSATSADVTEGAIGIASDWYNAHTAALAAECVFYGKDPERDVYPNFIYSRMGIARRRKSATIYNSADDFANEIMNHIIYQDYDQLRDVDVRDERSVREAVDAYLKRMIDRSEDLIYDIVVDFGHDDGEIVEFMEWDFGDYVEDMFDQDDIEWFESEPYSLNDIVDWFYNSSNAYPMLVDEVSTEILDDADYLEENRGNPMKMRAFNRTASSVSWDDDGEVAWGKSLNDKYIVTVFQMGDGGSSDPYVVQVYDANADLEEDDPLVYEFVDSNAGRAHAIEVAEGFVSKLGKRSSKKTAIYSWKVEHYPLTADQRARGVVFSSALLNYTIGGDQAIESEVIHEVYGNDPEKAETITRFKDFSFFKDMAEDMGYQCVVIERS
jgi:hypothetical protein